MPKPKESPQTHIREKEIKSQKALDAIAAYSKAEETLDALPVLEVNLARKARKDAKGDLLAALPIAKEPTLFRVGKYLMEVTPADGEDMKIETIRHPKPKLRFVDPEEE